MFIILEKDVIIEIADQHETDGDVLSMSMTTVGSLCGTPEDYSLIYTDQDGELRAALPPCMWKTAAALP